jgi:hypothetical protein
MKIIITEGQLNLIKEETDNSVKQIKFLKNYYNVEVSSDVLGKKITTRVKLVPKDTNNDMTPFVISSKAVWINRGGGLDFDDCTYIRNTERMPLLKYANLTYQLDNYVEHLHRLEAMKRVS